MSGFSYHHHDQSSAADASSLIHNYNFSHVPTSLQKDDTNNNIDECLLNLPLQFQSKDVSDIRFIDAAWVPSSLAVVPKNADLGMIRRTQMSKRRKKINSKVGSMQNDDVKKMKARKMEKEQSPAGTQEKGYIHVRARRGQATDSHSLAERVRREKIGERMNLLQSLVPGCDKIAGKAQVLDEIINYVQSLQTQVQILVEKLSILSPYMMTGYDEGLQLQGIAPPPLTTESICRLEASLSCMMMESSSNLLHFADDSHLNSLMSASSSPSLTSSQGDQQYFISQGAEVPVWEMDVQGHFGAIDEYWLEHLAQLE